MAIMSAKLKCQRGVTIIELMVASTISLIAIGAVGLLYIKGLEASTARSQTLYLRQSVNDAVRIISEDMLRAGFSTTGSSMKLSGATNVIEFSGTNEMAYVFTEVDTSVSPAVSTRREVAFIEKDMSGPSIKFCYSEVGISTALKTRNELLSFCDSTATHGASLLPQKAIRLDTFKITPMMVSTASATTQSIEVEVAATLIATGESYNRSKTVTVRNWQ